MGKVDETVIGFAVYEDATEFLGISEVTLPEISNITEEISGAGINGKYNSSILGQIEPMTMTFSFRTVTKDAIRLYTPGRHNLDLRAAQQIQNPTKGVVGVVKVKHVIVAEPVKLNMGKLATASTADVSGEYAVHYFCTYIDGKKMIEVDPLNYIYYVQGQDNRWEEIKKALGK